MRIVTMGGLLAASVLVSGCATVVRGTSQKFAIESTPTQAEVTLSTGQQCITPCSMKLKRRPGFTATVKKPGYQTQTLSVDSKLGGGGIAAGAGNILMGGIVGGIVDGTNGSMNNLSPNPLVVTLVPESAAAAAIEAAPVSATATAMDAVSAPGAAPAANAAEAAPAPTPGNE